VLNKSVNTVIISLISGPIKLIPIPVNFAGHCASTSVYIILSFFLLKKGVYVLITNSVQRTFKFERRFLCLVGSKC
jgi:hypothetical protein